MAAGESQCCSLAERGCVRRSFFVFFSYASKAVLKRFWKLVEEVVVEETLDIVSVSKTVVAGRSCRGVVQQAWYYRYWWRPSTGILGPDVLFCTARTLSVLAQPPCVANRRFSAVTAQRVILPADARESGKEPTCCRLLTRRARKDKRSLLIVNL